MDGRRYENLRYLTPFLRDKPVVTSPFLNQAGYFFEKGHLEDAVFTLQVLKQIFPTSWALPRCVTGSSCESSTTTEQEIYDCPDAHTHTPAETQQETIRVCQDGKLEPPFSEQTIQYLKWPVN